MGDVVVFDFAGMLDSLKWLALNPIKYLTNCVHLTLHSGGNEFVDYATDFLNLLAVIVRGHPVQFQDERVADNLVWF